MRQRQRRERSFSCHVSSKRTSRTDVIAQRLQGTFGPNQVTLVRQEPGRDDEERQQPVEPDLGTVTARLQRVTRIRFSFRNGFAIDACETIDQRQYLARPGGAALRLLSVIAV